MPKPEFDIVVIGGGAGGLVVAAGGAQLGAKVALVEKHKLGGDCLWYGCVPSKTLLKSARIAHQMRHAARWALDPAVPQPDLGRVMERVSRVIESIEPNDSAERFRGLGVDVVFGSGAFTGPTYSKSPAAASQRRTFVIATGSRPAVPHLPGLDRIPYLTNETLFDLREPVPHLLVVGAARSVVRWRRRFAAWEVRSRSSMSRRASFRAKTPTSQRSSRTRSKPRASNSGSARRLFRAPATRMTCA
jgi:pyruvate/2-oxoglutarate dehydrogenase complex dihydrolipoamide dehydrogenase (E3) component